MGPHTSVRSNDKALPAYKSWLWIFQRPPTTFAQREELCRVAQRDNAAARLVSGALWMLMVLSLSVGLIIWALPRIGPVFFLMLDSDGIGLSALWFVALLGLTLLPFWGGFAVGTVLWVALMRKLGFVNEATLEMTARKGPFYCFLRR